jgi:hypothetical protein
MCAAAKRFLDEETALGALLTLEVEPLNVPALRSTAPVAD